MKTADLRRIGWWVVAAVGVAVAVSLLSFAWTMLGGAFDPALAPRTRGQWMAWSFAYYLMWAALTPLVLALGRRVPFTREHWLGPLSFHLVAGVTISALAPVMLAYAFGAAVHGLDVSALPSLLAPYFGQLARFNAAASTPIYWLILAAGFAAAAYSEDQARQRQTVDLQQALVAAEVEALKMKLQPHFLFNALNSIGFLAVEKDAEGMVTIVERLGRLLWASMQSGGSQLITVREELALLDQYLSIEEVRFADRLHAVRCVAPSALDALIPSLVLQPMIENSIKHGFSRRIDASRLELSIAREHASLVVTVEDDGPGVPPGWDLTTHCGRGLKNVIERLEKIYPGAWSFTLRNGTRGGAVVRLEIPWQIASANEAPPAATTGC